MKNLTFWTSNPHKLAETRGILWFEIKWYTPEDLEKIKAACSWDLKEIQSMDIIEIVKRKSKDVFDILGRPVIVEDTGYFIDSLGWFPWPFVKYIVDGPAWIETLFKMMEWNNNRTVRAITWVSMYDWEKYTVWYWELEWRIPEKPRGDKFWWSNAFEVKWLNKTFWEITEEEKNHISMRKIALLDFIKNLEK